MYAYMVNFLQTLNNFLKNFNKITLQSKKFYYYIFLNKNKIISFNKLLVEFYTKNLVYKSTENKFFLQSLFTRIARNFSILTVCMLLQNFFKKINFWFLIINKFLTGTIKFIPVVILNNINIFFLKKNISIKRNNITMPNIVITSLFAIYTNLRSVMLPLFIALIAFIVLLDFFSVDFLRQTGVWAVFGFLAFWLFSSFNFFLKRYRFGKFTSSIQRFWKRTNVYFWVIEGFLFSLFFYYYLNSSQEPIYMYDESSLNQQFLPSLTASYQSYLVLLFIFFYTLYLLLALPTFKSTQQILHLGLMTLLYTYIYLLENYQVYYILTAFYENYWVYDAEQLIWSLEIEVPRIRTKQQYFLIALILKYWHFVFIYLSWLFVVMKSFEKKQISFILLGLSSQNVLILFFLNILFNAQWLKWVIKRFGETAYYWFFSATNEMTILNFFQELCVMCLLDI